MVQIDQNLQTAFNGRVRFCPFDIRNKADAACIMLIAWVI